MKTSTLLSLPVALLFGMIVTCTAEPPVFKKLSDIITTAPVGSIPSGRTWTPVELAKASEAISRHADGGSAELAVKLLRIENPNPDSATIRFSVVREDFRAKGRPYAPSMVCSIARDKADRLLAAKEGTSLKMRGTITSAKIGGNGIAPILYVSFDRCESVE